MSNKIRVMSGLYLLSISEQIRSAWGREGESSGQCIVTKNVHGYFDIPRIIFPYLEDFKNYTRARKQLTSRDLKLGWGLLLE